MAQQGNQGYASDEPYYSNPQYRLYVNSLPTGKIKDRKGLPSRGQGTPPLEASLNTQDRILRRKQFYEGWENKQKMQTEQNKENALKTREEDLANILSTIREIKKDIINITEYIDKQKNEVERLSTAGITGGIVSKLVGRKSSAHLQAEHELNEAEKQLNLNQLDEERYQKEYKDLYYRPVEYRDEVTGKTVRVGEIERKNTISNAVNSGDKVIIKEALNSKNIQVNANVVGLKQTVAESTNDTGKYSTKWRFAETRPRLPGQVDKSRSFFSDYQLAPIARMGGKCRDMPGIILYHSMGSGKTRTAIGLAATLTNKPNSVTIVVPKGLKAPWVNELKEVGVFKHLVLNKKSGQITSEAVTEETISAMNWAIPNEAKTSEEWEEFFVQKGLLAEGVQPLDENTKSINSSRRGIYSTATTNAQARDFRSMRDLPIWGRFVKSPELYTEEERAISSSGRAMGEEPNGPFKGFPCKPKIKYEFRFNVIEYDKILDPAYASLIKDHVLIFDEAHNLLPIYKSASCDPSAQYKLRVVLESALRRIFLTGTPIQTEITDLSILINLSQSASAMPIIAENPNVFKDYYYPPAGGEKLQWRLKQISGWTFGLIGNIGMGAAAWFTGGLALPAAAGLLAASNLLSIGLSVVSMDTRSLNTKLFAEHCAPYLSYFDVEYDSPENKTMFPYKSKRIAAGSRAEIAFQNKVDLAWQVAYWDTINNIETTQVAYDSYMVAMKAASLASYAGTAASFVSPTGTVAAIGKLATRATRVVEVAERSAVKFGEKLNLIIKVYYNSFLNPNMNLTNIIANNNYSFVEPVGMKRRTEVKREIPEENDADEGEIEHAIPFDDWQNTIYVAQFINLEKPDIDIETMLDNYDTNLAEIFGPFKDEAGTLKSEKYKMLSERIINKPSTVEEFMTRMRVVCNLSKYCFYYEPLLISDNTDIRTKERRNEFDGYSLDFIKEAEKAVFDFDQNVTKATEKYAIIGASKAKKGGAGTDQVLPIPKASLNTVASQNTVKTPTEMCDNPTPILASPFPIGNNTYLTVRKREIHTDINWRAPTDKSNIKALPDNYSPYNIFEVGKFERALELIVDCRQRNHFLPLVYSNFNKYGFQLFSAFLNNRGVRHLIIHSDWEYNKWNERMLTGATGLTQLPFPRYKSSKPENKIDAEEWRIENQAELEHYKQYIESYPNLKNASHVKKELLKLVVEKEYVPMCILLHPDIKEGLSFTMQPEMICLETPLGIGNRDQIYARVLRALRLTPQGGIPDSEYYEMLPVIENGKEKYPGVVRPQYIMNGIFLQENMIAYKTEHTPQFAATLKGQSITGSIGYITKNVGMEELKEDSQQTDLWARDPVKYGKRAITNLLLNKMASSSIEDFEPKQDSHYQRVPRVKKVIHQLVGADNIQKVQIPEIIRKIHPSIPSAIRINFAGISLDSDGCKGRREPTEKYIELPTIRWKIDFQALKMNMKAYWGEYLKGSEAYWTKIGTRTFDEVCAAMPVPWQTISPDDWVDNINTKQKDSVEKIRLDFYRAEKRGLCIRKDEKNISTVVASVNEPLEKDCIWESPQKPGVCRLKDLSFVHGGTPSVDVKRLQNIKADSGKTSSKSKPLINLARVESILDSKYSKNAVDAVSKMASRKLTADTIAEPLAKQIEAALKAYIPTIIKEGSRQIGSVDIDAYTTMAKGFYQNARAHIEKPVELAKKSYEDLRARVVALGDSVSPKALEALKLAEEKYKKLAVEAKAKLEETKAYVQKTIDDTKRYIGITGKNDLNTNFANAYRARNSLTLRNNNNIRNTQTNNSSTIANNTSDPGNSPRTKGGRKTYRRRPRKQGKKTYGAIKHKSNNKRKTNKKTK